MNSSETHTIRLTAAGWGAAAASALLIALTAPQIGGLVAQTLGDDFPAAAVAAAHLGVLVTAGWILLAAAGGLLHLKIPGTRAFLRAGLFTTVVVTAVATPAHADSSHDVNGLRLPDRPVTASAPAPTSAPAPDHPDSSVVVRSGDSLWTIAGRYAPPHASDADLSRATERWHTSNRQTIGPDPDLIHPGQILYPPAHEQDAS